MDQEIVDMREVEERRATESGSGSESSSSNNNSNNDSSSSVGGAESFLDTAGGDNNLESEYLALTVEETIEEEENPLLVPVPITGDV
jgi:hypothetical protein